jgi:Tfp pilus assembly protein PilZ
MKDIRILIVAKDSEAGKAYGTAVSEIGAQYDVASSFEQMASLAMERPYNGLMIDILTLVRCSKEEKVIAYDSINIYPVLRVKWEPKQKRISLGPLEQSFSPDLESVLKFFIENRCSAFKGRALRRHKRRMANLNLLFSRDASFPEAQTWRAFTVTVSRGGIFLHTMQHLEEGEQIWLKFVDQAAAAPIAGTVRWALPWGVSRAIPGVGVEFEALSREQEQELEKALNL